MTVEVGDAGAVAIERPEGQTGLGSLGEERCQRFRWSWQRCYPSRLAPPLPQAPAARVHLAGGWTEFRVDGGCDAFSVAGSQRVRSGRGIKNGGTEGRVRHRPLSPPHTSPREGRLGRRDQTSAKEGLWRGGQIPGTFQARETLISRA